MTIKRGLLPFLTLSIVLVFSACFSPWEGEQGAVTVNVGNGEAMWGNYIIKDLLHIITITGPGPKQEARFMGEGTAFFTTAPGTWKIDVKAYFGGGQTSGGGFENYPNIYDIPIEDLNPVAVGSASVGVRAGKSNRVSIAMRPAGEPTIEPPVEPTAFFTLTVGVITGQNGSWQGIKYGTVTITPPTDSSDLEPVKEGELGLKTMANIPDGTPVTITAIPTPLSTGGSPFHFVKWVREDDINDDACIDNDEEAGKSFTLPISGDLADANGNITLYAVFDGDGTANAPFNITSEDGLKGITLNGHYALMTDITITAAWTPKGSTSTSSFTGTLDGRGHTIHLGNNNVNAVGTPSYAGLFGYIGTNGTVKNLKLDGSISVMPTGNNASLSVGAVAGFSQGTIENVASSVTINGSGSRDVQCGGIVGQLGTDNTGARIIKNCTVTANITATTTGNTATYDAYTGGIAGRNGGSDNPSSSISFCLVGGNKAIKGRIVGGIVGGVDTEYASIKNSVVVDSQVISAGSSTYVGRIVGTLNSSTKLSDNYASAVKLFANNNTDTEIGANPTFDFHGADFANVNNIESWKNDTSGPGWTFANPDDPDNLPSETNPWVWSDNKPKLWFE